MDRSAYFSPCHIVKAVTVSDYRLIVRVNVESASYSDNEVC